MTRADKLAFVTALAAIALAYALMAPTYVIGGDNGEFVTLMHAGGVAHPPGYPLYTLYLRALRWLPGQTPAHSAALATALLGVCAAAALYGAARVWAVSPPFALLAALVYAFSPLAWKLSVHAEVFALNALLAAGLLAVCGPEARCRGARRMFAIAAICGLGAAHHHSLALLAPVALFGAWQARQESAHPWRALILAAPIFACGFLFYLYPYLRSRDASGWVWAEAFTPHTMLQHFLRAEYGTLRLVGGHERGSSLAQLAALVLALSRSLAWVLAPFALIGGLMLARARRAGVVPLLVAFVVTGPLFVLCFNVPLSGPERQVVERFYLLPELLLCLLLGLACERYVPAQRLGNLGALGLAFLLAATSFGRVREYLRPTVDLFGRNVLAQVPPDAVIFGSGDHCVFAFLYLQEVLGLRPDVIYAHIPMLDRPWYRERLRQRFPDIDWSAKGRPLLEAVMAHHAVYLTEPFSTPIVHWYPSQPEGALVRILPASTPRKDPAQLEQLNDKIYSEYHWERTVPPDPNTWNGLVQDAYARAWLAISELYRKLGYADQAHATLVRGALYVPWLMDELKPAERQP